MHFAFFKMLQHIRNYTTIVFVLHNYNGVSEGLKLSYCADRDDIIHISWTIGVEL